MITLRILAVLLPLLALAPAQVVPTAGIAPDAELQAGLRRLAEDSTPDEQRAAWRFLSENAGDAHVRLVPQLLLFKEQSRSTREGMLFGAVVEQLHIPAADIVAGLVPLFEGADATRRAALGGVLSEFEDRSIDRGANFDGYRSFLGGELSVGLLRYLYETDPDAALLSLTRARVQTAAEVRSLVWAQHAIADLRWQLRFGPERVVLADGKTVPTLPGAQDEASQFVQLTWLFTTQPERLKVGRSVEMPLAISRKLETWIYDVVAEEPLFFSFGQVATFQLRPRRAAQGGDLTPEIWIAPSLQYLPVRILIRDDKGNWVDLMLDAPPLQAATR